MDEKVGKNLAEIERLFVADIFEVREALDEERNERDVNVKLRDYKAKKFDLMDKTIKQIAEPFSRFTREVRSSSTGYGEQQAQCLTFVQLDEHGPQYS